MRDTLRKVWDVLFPKPAWVLEFEQALEADRATRQRQYAYWESTLRSAVRESGR